MEMDRQFLSIYGKFVTSQTASFSRADISEAGILTRERGLAPDSCGWVLNGSRKAVIGIQNG